VGRFSEHILNGSMPHPKIQSPVSWQRCFLGLAPPTSATPTLPPAFHRTSLAKHFFAHYRSRLERVLWAGERRSHRRCDLRYVERETCCRVRTGNVSSGSRHLEFQIQITTYTYCAVNGPLFDARNALRHSAESAGPQESRHVSYRRVCPNAAVGFCCHGLCCGLQYIS